MHLWKHKWIYGTAYGSMDTLINHSHIQIIRRPLAGRRVRMSLYSRFSRFSRFSQFPPASTQSLLAVVFILPVVFIVFILPVVFKGWGNSEPDSLNCALTLYAYIPYHTIPYHTIHTYLWDSMDSAFMHTYIVLSQKLQLFYLCVCGHEILRC